MANFQLNHAMRSFTDLDEAARTYDTVFDAWTRADDAAAARRPPHPLRAHGRRISTARCAPCSTFSACPGTRRCSTIAPRAAERDHVRTASYAQVTEPIYTRAAGRWERYRDADGAGPADPRALGRAARLRDVTAPGSDDAGAAARRLCSCRRRGGTPKPPPATSRSSRRPGRLGDLEQSRQCAPRRRRPGRRDRGAERGARPAPSRIVSRHRMSILGARALAEAGAGRRRR